MEREYKIQIAEITKDLIVPLLENEDANYLKQIDKHDISIANSICKTFDIVYNHIKNKIEEI